MKKAIIIIMALLMVPSLVACGGAKKPQGMYAVCVKFDDKWLDLGGRTEIKGNKAIVLDAKGRENEGKVIYDGDIIRIELEDGTTSGVYKYDSENDLLINQMGDKTGMAALVKVK